MAVVAYDRRVRQTVVFPRHRIEEQLVDIQAASDEASHLINRAAGLVEYGNLPGAIQTLGAADTMVRLMGQDAWALAGEISTCPDREDTPGHGEAA